MKTVACALLLASAAALAPTPARTAVKTAPKPALHYQVAAAATAFAPLAALAGGQSEGTGLSLGIDDPREGTVLWVIGGFFFFTYYNWPRSSPTRTATSSRSTTSAASRLSVTTPPL